MTFDYIRNWIECHTIWDHKMSIPLPVATKSSQFISDTESDTHIASDFKEEKQEFNVKTQWNGKSNNVEINDTFLWALSLFSVFVYDCAGQLAILWFLLGRSQTKKKWYWIQWP